MVPRRSSGTGPVRALDDGRLVQDYPHWRHGDGIWQFDPETLEPVQQVTVGFQQPAALNRIQSDFPGMAVRWKGDAELAQEPGSATCSAGKRSNKTATVHAKSRLPTRPRFGSYTFAEP